MTTRRFNYTERHRIKQQDVEILLDESGAPPKALSRVSLADYLLPLTSEVVVEAYADWSLMRFSIGTLGALKTTEPLLLSEFDSTEGLRFRVKVLGTGDQAGLILAEADRIRPVSHTTQRDARSFIVVRPADIGAQAWRLDIDDANPVLLINAAFDDWRSAARSAAFRSLVFPAVLRELLREAAQEGEDDEVDSWVADCLAMARNLGGGDPPPGQGDPGERSDDELNDWVDIVVDRFCYKHRLLGVARQAVEEAAE